MVDWAAGEKKRTSEAAALTIRSISGKWRELGVSHIHFDCAYFSPSSVKRQQHISLFSSKAHPIFFTNIASPPFQQCQWKILIFSFDFFLFSFSFVVSRKTLKLKCLRNIISLPLSSFTSSILCNVRHLHLQGREIQSKVYAFILCFTAESYNRTDFHYKLLNFRYVVNALLFK